jgi:hypothetical protein
MNEHPSKMRAWALRHPKSLERAYHYSSFSSGILLTIGFIGALIAQRLSPLTDVPITNVEGSFRKAEIGQIPKARLNSELNQGMKPVIRDVPFLDASGRPETHEVTRTVRGRGRVYHSGEEIREILIPRLGNPPYLLREERRLRMRNYDLDGRILKAERPDMRPGQKMRSFDKKRFFSERRWQQPTPHQDDVVKILWYDPNVVQTHTAVFERLQKIEFHSAIDPERWAICGAVVGTVIGVGIFLLREWAQSQSKSQ